MTGVERSITTRSPEQASTASQLNHDQRFRSNRIITIASRRNALRAFLTPRVLRRTLCFPRFITPAVSSQITGQRGTRESDPLISVRWPLRGCPSDTQPHVIQPCRLEGARSRNSIKMPSIPPSKLPFHRFSLLFFCFKPRSSTSFRPRLLPPPSFDLGHRAREDSFRSDR